MDQPARMWKTLVCLVMTMTGTALLLGWLDPSPPLTYPAAPHDEIVRLAKAAVSEDVTVHPEYWRDVALGMSPHDVAGPLLSATTDGTDHHFRVDRQGRSSCGAAWRHQQSAAGYPHTIRIAVAPPVGGGPISEAQWGSIRALLSALGDSTGLSGSALPVRLDRAWEAVYGVEPGSVFELAPLDG